VIGFPHLFAKRLGSGAKTSQGEAEKNVGFFGIELGLGPFF
jgi:hypothetical protein